METPRETDAAHGSMFCFLSLSSQERCIVTMVTASRENTARKKKTLKERERERERGGG
jgi:hypothetical protein